MGFVIKLSGYQPSPRGDGVPWVSADVLESDAADGVFTVIQSFPLEPVDEDPTAPAIRSFTVTNASAQDSLWYQVRFLDGAGDQEITAPRFNSPVTPTAAEIRAELDQIAWAEFGYPEPAAGDPDKLDVVLTESEVELRSYIGTAYDEPGQRGPLIRRALKMLVAYNAAGQSQELLDTATDYDMISSLTASTYSESRRGPGAGRSAIHPWPALDRLLRGIIFFDQAGVAPEGPAIDSPGLLPRPGHEFMPPPWLDRWTWDFPPAGYPIIVPADG